MTLPMVLMFQHLLRALDSPFSPGSLMRWVINCTSEMRKLRCREPQ